MTCTNNTIDICPTCNSDTTVASKNNVTVCGDCNVATCNRCDESSTSCISWGFCSGKNNDCGKNLCSDCAQQKNNESFDSVCKECSKENVDDAASAADSNGTPPTCSVASQ